jgi:hypothetical protein
MANIHADLLSGILASMTVINLAFFQAGMIARWTDCRLSCSPSFSLAF